MLLFGQQPQGLLDVACEAWEKWPFPFRSLQKMQEPIDWVTVIVLEQMETAQ